MTEYLTKDEYETFVKLQDKFSRCLEQSAIEIFVMQHKQEPAGDFCDDHELYDKDKYMVQFETWSCGESVRDTVYVPIKYIYDEGYREYYDKHLENETRMKKAQKEAEMKRLEDTRAEEKEIRDQAEYERLKKKYDVMAVAEQNDRVNQFDMEGFCGVLRTDVRDNKDIVDMLESVALITKYAQSPYKKQWVDNPQCDIKTNRESRLYDAHNTTMDILATVWTYYCHKQYHLRFPNMWKIIRNEITHKIEQSHRVRTIRTDCGHIITYDAESNSTYDGYGYGIWWETE